MFKNVKNILDIESVRVCRLCLAEEEDLIYIFNPKGYQGFRLWEIVEELLQMEVSKKDGLPWTICEECISKVKEFKHFKKACIKAKISFLNMIADRGMVEPVKAIRKRRRRRTSGKDSDEVEVVSKGETPVVSTDEDPLREVTTVVRREEDLGGKINLKEEEVDADESPSDAESCSQEIHWKDESTHTENSNEDAALSGDPLDMIDVKEDVDAGESCSEAVTYNQNDLQENDTFDVGASNVVCLPIEIGELCGVKEEDDDPSESLAGEEASLISVAGVISVPPWVGNMVDGCSMAGGSPNMCEEIVSEMRDDRRKNITKKFERNTSLGVLPGEHSLRNINKFSAKTGDDLKSSDCIKSAFKLSDTMPSELRHFDSDRKQLVGGKEFICDHCGVTYTDKNELVTHVGGHISRNSLSTRVMLEDSSPNCSESRVTGIQSSEEFKCGMCGKEFKLKRLLTAHYVVHREFKPFKCEICGKDFKRKENLLSHSTVHLDLRPFKCETCGKMFKRKNSLVSHSKMHLDLRPFKCETCGKEFKLKKLLQAHSIIHLDFKPFKCDICGKEFSRKIALTSHLAIHSNSRPFKCDACGKGFTYKSTLVKHSAMHSGLRSFKCDTCGMEFTYQCALVKHSDTMHSGWTPFKCNTCGKEFTYKSALVKHSLLHSGLRPFKCDTCGLRFARKCSLDTHSFIHTGLKPFKCDICGKGFTHKSYLVTHSVMHSGLKPFKCVTCGKGFNWRANLRRHSVVHC